MKFHANGVIKTIIIDCVEDLWLKQDKPWTDDLHPFKCIKGDYVFQNSQGQKRTVARNKKSILNFDSKGKFLSTKELCRNDPWYVKGAPNTCKN